MKTEDVPDEVIVDEVEHEHPRIERELDATKLDSLVKKAVANEKLNQLYHRIKDTFLPQLMHI